MLLPHTAKDSYNDFHAAFMRQLGRRIQFKLDGHDDPLITGIKNALNNLMWDRGAAPSQFRHLPTSRRPMYTDWPLGEELDAIGMLRKLGLERHAKAKQLRLDMVAAEPRLTFGETDEKQKTFVDPELERQRLGFAEIWAEAEASRDDAGLIERIAELADITFTAPEDYDRTLVAEIENSPVFKDMTDSTELRIRLGSDGDLRRALETTDIMLKSYIWDLSAQPATLALSNRGLIAIPDINHRRQDPVARYWPSGTEAFTIPTTELEQSELRQQQLRQFTDSIKTIHARQAKLQPGTGGGLASILARASQPIATYRLFLHMGGFGCSNRTLFAPWRDVLITIVAIVLAHLLFDLGEVFQGALKLRPFDVVQLALIAAMLAGAAVQLLTGIALVHGTILRGLGRQHLKGGTNLPGAGETNILLRLMGHTAT